MLAALWWRLGTPHRTPVSAAALFDDRPRSAADHRATAEAHAAQGHWTQALQERVRAVVRSLEERALLDVRPGRTAVEAAAEAGRALPGHTDALRAAAREFDDVTYGGRSATEESYRRVAALDRDLEGSRPRFAGRNAADDGRRSSGSRAMTADAAPPATSASPTARQLLTRTRGIVLALVLLLAGRRRDRRGPLGRTARRLDPRSTDPYGSRAVAALLADRGVDTRVVTTLGQSRRRGRRGHHAAGRRPRPADARPAVPAARRHRRLGRPDRPRRPRQHVRGDPRPGRHRGSRH